MFFFSYLDALELELFSVLATSLGIGMGKENK